MFPRTVQIDAQPPVHLAAQSHPATVKPSVVLSGLRLRRTLLVLALCTVGCGGGPDGEEGGDCIHSGWRLYCAEGLVCNRERGYVCEELRAHGLGGPCDNDHNCPREAYCSLREHICKGSVPCDTETAHMCD